MRCSVVVALVGMSGCAGGYHTDPPRQGAALVQPRPAIDRLQARLDIALRTRGQLTYYFVQLGAVARPPVPDPLAEEPGPPPYDGAQWIDGRWQWKDGAWQWIAGSWGEPDRFSPSESEVAIGGELDVPFGLPDDELRNLPPGYGPALRDHRTHANPSSWRSTSHPEASVRDHRTAAAPAWTSSSHPDATVRDHRDEDRGKHDDSKDTKDYGGTRFGRPGR